MNEANMLLYDKILGDLNPNNLDVLPEENPLELLAENNPCDDDTIGSLISKLSCATVQMWHNQDLLYKIRNMDAQEFATIYSHKMPELHALIKRACDLNVQRANIMDAIDRKLLQDAQ